MSMLKRILYLESAELGVYGLVTALFPIWLLETVFDQPPLGEYAWVRMSGIQAIGFAMLMVIVANRIESVWWFCWAFAITGGALAVLAAVNALFGLLDGVSPVFWWLMAAGAALNTAGMLVGLAKTGTERPVV